MLSHCLNALHVLRLSILQQLYEVSTISHVLQMGNESIERLMSLPKVTELLTATQLAFRSRLPGSQTHVLSRPLQDTTCVGEVRPQYHSSAPDDVRGS